MTNLLSIALFGMALAGFAGPLLGDEPGGSEEFRVAGYLPNYRFGEVEVESLGGLTDLIIFSAEPTVNGGLDVGRLDNCPWETLLEFKTKRRVRLILAIGGWGRSSNFAQVARSEEKRQAFAEAVVRFALDKRLDGIDLDWEHPKGESEEEAYGELLAGLRSALKPHGLLLTVTIASWQRLPATAIDSVDAVQLMAYDHDQEHSTMEGAQRDVQTLIDSQFPSRKIVLGLPFYGRDIQSREAITYREIVQTFAPDSAIDQIGSIYFNGADTVRRKVEFAIDAQLGGIMIWEVGQDAVGDRSLLKVIRDNAGANR